MKLFIAKLFFYIIVAPAVILFREEITPSWTWWIVAALTFGVLCVLRLAFVGVAVFSVFSCLIVLLIDHIITEPAWENPISVGIAYGMAFMFILAVISSLIWTLAPEMYDDTYEIRPSVTRIIFSFVLLTFGPAVWFSSWTLTAIGALFTPVFLYWARRHSYELESYHPSSPAPVYATPGEEPY